MEMMASIDVCFQKFFFICQRNVTPSEKGDGRVSSCVDSKLKSKLGNLHGIDQTDAWVSLI